MGPSEQQATEALNSDSQQYLPGALGMEVVQADSDHVVVRLPITNRVRQPLGLLHGGATVALAETAASIGTWLGIDQTSYHAVGMEINANHLRPVIDGVITAEARPLHRGRNTWVWDIRVTDEGGKLVAISRCTVAIVPQQR
jgi:1,4-dihydroxy-2-naphthoyl-CoA hydrolase